MPFQSTVVADRTMSAESLPASPSVLEVHMSSECPAEKGPGLEAQARRQPALIFPDNPAQPAAWQGPTGADGFYGARTAA